MERRLTLKGVLARFKEEMAAETNRFRFELGILITYLIGLWLTVLGSIGAVRLVSAIGVIQGPNDAVIALCLVLIVPGLYRSWKAKSLLELFQGGRWWQLYWLLMTMLAIYGLVSTYTYHNIS